jgi:putative tryptophan/tyrosine transport system substrate-binding protein
MNRRRLMLLLGCAVILGGPLRAQQKAIPVIGFLGGTSPSQSASILAAFHQGLGDFGYAEGQNVAIEYRWAEGRYDRLPQMAADLVARKVNVILSAGGTTGAVAAKTATSVIPIVFISGDDPVEHGLVASLARPGGNLTGVTMLDFELSAKRLELLSEMVPHAKVIALLNNPNNASAERMMRELQEAARAKDVQLHSLKAGTEGEIDAAFDALVPLQVGALIVASEPFFISHRQKLVALASRYAVPAIYGVGGFGAIGGLISYGPSLPATFRQLGTYAGKILNGAKPADLPVEQSTIVELVINLKTAEALGLAVPQSLLARADRVIE